MATKIYQSSGFRTAGNWQTTPQAAFGSALVRLADTVSQWLERARGRRQLRSLDDRLLHDLGVTRADVEREAAKPFWRP